MRSDDLRRARPRFWTQWGYALAGLGSILGSSAIAEDLGRLSGKVDAIKEGTKAECPPPNPTGESTRGAGEVARYDQVPSASMADIRARLKLTLEILAVSGRAYDYRVLKQPELRKILSEVKQDPLNTPPKRNTRKQE